MAIKRLPSPAGKRKRGYDTKRSCPAEIQLQLVGGGVFVAATLGIR